MSPNTCRPAIPTPRMKPACDPSAPKCRARVPFQKGYDNIEEFFAVLIANIYRSECDRKELRKDHGKDFIEMSEAEFIRTGMNRSHLRQLRHQHPTLFSDLRDIDIPFNPTRRILDI